MTDEPVRIEFTTNAQETAAAIESINAALMRIPESANAAGTGIDSFVSRSTSALGRLSAEISRVSSQFKTLSGGVPQGVAQTGAVAAPLAPQVPPATGVQPTAAPPQPPPYEVRPYSYQPDPRGMLRPVYGETMSAPSLTAAEELKRQIRAQGPNQFATIAQTQPIQAQSAALKELAEKQREVAQLPITSPQNTQALSTETQGIEAKTNALTESLTTQRQVTQAAEQAKPVVPPTPAEVKPAEVAPVAPQTVAVTAETTAAKASLTELETKATSTETKLSEIGTVSVNADTAAGVAGLKEMDAQADITKTKLGEVSQQSVKSRAEQYLTEHPEGEVIPAPTPVTPAQIIPDTTRIDTSSKSLKQLKQDVTEARGAIDGSTASYDRYLKAQDALTTGTAKFNAGLQQLNSTQREQAQVTQSATAPATSAPQKSWEQTRAEAFARDAEMKAAKEAQTGQTQPAEPFTPPSVARTESVAAPLEGAGVAAQSVGQLSTEARLLDMTMKSTGASAKEAAQSLIASGYSADKVKAAFGEIGVAAPQQTFAEVKAAAREAKNEFDGTADAAKKVSAAQSDLSGMTSKLKTAMTGAVGDAPKSLEQLRVELGNAKNSFDGSEQSLTRLKSANEAYNSRLKESKNATGELTTETSKMGSMFERQMMRIGIGIAIWSTLRMAQQEIQKTVQAMETYSTAVARFASVTAQSIGEANAQYKALQSTVAEQGFAPTEAAPAITAAARFEKNPAGQQELVGTAAKLSEVMDLKSPTQAVNELAAANKATGLSYKELGDAAAYAFQKTGADPGDILKGLTTAQSLADDLGISWQKAFSVLIKSAESSNVAIGVVGQTLARFSGNINSLSGDKLISFVNGFKALGINVLDANMNLKSTGDILGEIGSKSATLSPQQIQDALELLGGEKLREQARQAGLGIVQAEASGIDEGLPQVQGALDRNTKTIDDALGQTVKRIKARAEEMRTQFNVMGAISSDIRSGDFAVAMANIFAPLQGLTPEEGAKKQLRFAETRQIVESKGPEAAKQNALESFTGMSPQDVRQAADDFNNTLKRMNISEGLISEEEITAKMASAAATAGQAAATSFVSAFSGVGNALSGIVKSALSGSATGIVNDVKNALNKLQGRPTTGTPETRGTTIATPFRSSFQSATPQPATSAGQQAPLTAQQAYVTTVRKAMSDSNATDASISSALQMKNMLDLTKYSYDEIARAKALFPQMEAQDIALLREQLSLLGMSTAEINKAVNATIAEGNATQQVVRDRQQAVIMGQRDAQYYQKALAEMRQQKTEAKSSESNFVFQRHKEISPEQFPQLQALTAMYDAMLTKMGSPEKEKNINLLLGDNNTFKTMTARLSALQMAMEDLTKVEKAQLSGTWNMPSGTTALVPISSLDVQRWNKGEAGGGMSPESLMALIEQMGLAAKAQEEMGGGGGGGGSWWSEEQPPAQPRNEMPATPAWMAFADLPRKKPFSLEDIGMPSKTTETVSPIQKITPIPAEVPATTMNAMATFSQMFANNLARSTMVGGRIATTGGGGIGVAQPPVDRRYDGVEDIRSRRTTETRKETAEDTTRATVQVGQKVDNTTAGVRALGGILMVPLLQMLYQLMQINAKTTTGGTTGTTGLTAVARATTTQAPTPLMSTRTAMQPQTVAGRLPPPPSAKPVEQLLSPLLSRLSEPPAGSTRQPPQSMQKMQAPPVTVNVSMLPIKATLAANLSVVMDGRVIARALMPLMYDMLTRAARGQSVQPRGVLR